MLIIEIFQIGEENSTAEIDWLAILLQGKGGHVLDSLQDKGLCCEIAENNLATAHSSARLAKSDIKDIKEIEREMWTSRIRFDAKTAT